MPLAIAFTAPGNYTIEDDGIRGNNTSVIRDANGVIIQTFVHPSDTLNFVTITSGVNLTFNVADSFGLAHVTVGALGDLAASPDSIVVKAMRGDAIITLVSRTTITEGGSDVTPDLVASGIVLSAVSGVGTPANALETQGNFFEVETVTGGINIANSGFVQVGGITPAVAGLDVLTSGDLKFSTVGYINLADDDGTAAVHGGDLSGNVTLSALGGHADIFAGFDHPSVYAAGGGITLNAGRDVRLGVGANFDNDILAMGDIMINAGHDFLLDSTVDVKAGAFGGVVGGDVIVTVGHDIRLTNPAGGLQTIEAVNGDVTLTTGPDGTYFQSTTYSATVKSTDNIFLNADNVTLLNGGLNTTGFGQIAVRPVTAGRPITLGTASDAPSTLGLSDDELDRLFAVNVSIGDANTGAVEFTAPSSPGIISNMVIESASEIFLNSALFLPGSLTLRAGDDLHISTAASFESTGGGFAAFVDNAQGDDSAGGFGNLDGLLTVSTSIQLTGNLDADTLRGSAANDILDGKGGADTLVGGLGDDFFHVDNALDSVTEGAGDGANDRIFASVSYTQGAGVYVERLTTSDNFGTAPINLTGNELTNIVFGNAGANVLDGRGGADTLVGLGGDDWFFVDNAADAVSEGAGGGANDRIFASVSYTQGAGVQVERLTTSDNLATTAINLTGNELANIIFGNAGANVLDGKAGADTLVGLGGDDWFHVDNAADAVSEGAGGGANDRVFASVSYTLGAGVQVERLTTSDNGATTAINLTGNELSNIVFGNAGANVLDGKGGADTLVGMDGADTFAFTTALGSGNVDSISGFSVPDDTIQLENAVFTGLAAGALAAGAFNTGSAAAQADDRIIYNSATGALLFDADGVGGVAGVQFATVSPGLAMAASEFFVI